MSQTSQWFAVPAGDLAELAGTLATGDVEARRGRFAEALGRATLERAEYQWDGHVVAGILDFLCDHDIDLLAGEHADFARAVAETLGSAWFAFTPSHRARFLDKIDPEAFSTTELTAHYEALFERSGEGGEQALQDAVAFVRQAVDAATDGRLVLLVIG